MVSVQINNYKFGYPEKMEELTADQLLGLGRNFHRLRDQIETQWILFLEFVKPHWGKMGKNIMQLDLESKDDEKRLRDQELMIALAELNLFLLDRNCCSKILLPVFDFGGKKYYGPADRIDSSTIMEYAYAEYLFWDYIYKQKERSLTELVAVLYRKKGHANPGDENYRGDLRCGFNKLNVNGDADELTLLPAEIKKAILIQYIGIRNWIADKYPVLFPVMEGNVQVEEKYPEWAGVAHNLPAPKFGTIEEAERANVHVVLRFIEDGMIKKRAA